MKSNFISTLGLFSFVFGSAALAQQASQNYELALPQTKAGILKVTSNSADVDQNYATQHNVDTNNYWKQITPDYSVIYDQNTKASQDGKIVDTQVNQKYFTADIRKNKGKVTSITQARRANDDQYHFETITIADDGSVGDYTYCEVTKADATHSNCITITPSFCGDLAAKNVNLAQLNKDLETCAHLDKTLDGLKSSLEKPELQKVSDQNLDRLNKSAARRYILGEDGKLAKKTASIAAANADPEKETRTQLIQDVVRYGKTCNDMKKTGFMNFEANSAPAVPAPAAPAAK